MKFILALLLFVSNPAFAAHDEWTTADTYREVAYQIIDAVDWAQTRNISHQMSDLKICEQKVDQSGCYPNGKYLQSNEEINPLLGHSPSILRVNRYFALTVLTHIGIAYALPKDWRAAFQYVTIGIETGYVAHNFSIGINAKF